MAVQRSKQTEATKQEQKVGNDQNLHAKGTQQRDLRTSREGTGNGQRNQTYSKEELKTSNIPVSL